jgi:5'-3' exonuclease
MRKLTVGNMETQAIFGMVRSMRIMLEANPGWTPIILWDGKSQWRKDLYPDYKENRKPKDAKQIEHKNSYKQQSPFTRKALSLLGIRQMLVVTAEADDMAGLLSKKLSSSGKKVKLITADQDWLQLINENVTWFDPINDYVVTHKNFTEFTGYFSVDAFLQGKAIVGDNSDFIEGVDRIGKVIATKILAEFGTVEKFFEQCDSGVFVPRLKIHKNLADPKGREIFHRNMKLMDLRNVPEPDKKDIQIIAPDYDEDRFQFLIEKLAFTSLLRDFDRYMQPFRTLQKAA